MKTAAEPYLRGTLSPKKVGWQRAHPAFDAWWRPRIDTETGELRIWLAMRFDLCGQVGCELPEVSDQLTLGTVGKMFGAIMDNPPVSDVLTKGTQRLAVLSHTVSDDLLAEADSEAQDTVEDSEAG